MSATLDRLFALEAFGIKLGLDNMRTLVAALGHPERAYPTIHVAGTNGKGSVCAMLESILDRAGYRVGLYTSPHLLRYNERVRIARAEARDGDLVRAFAAVEAARGDVPLTYFEFGTLAAVWLFADAGVDVAVLEVGLGGRLDAVNVFDADCAVVVSVDIDHVEFLGGDRESIGYEKAGIFRRGRPAVCADPEPPERLMRHARDVGAQLLRFGVDFGCAARAGDWRYWGPRGARNALPYPALRGAPQLGNAAAAIAALDCLRERLPVSMDDVRAGLLQVELPARFQVLPGRPTVILDVAHNPQAARALAASLRALPAGGRTLAVFAMLKDKDAHGVAAALKERIARWFVAGLDVPRGADPAQLERALTEAGAGPVTVCRDAAQAYAQACDMAEQNDRILVFGSFYTVAAVLRARATPPRG